MENLDPALAGILRQKFLELRAIANAGLAALGRDDATTAVDVGALREVNAKLRHVALDILSSQDHAER